jgi:hypothetical protein
MDDLVRLAMAKWPNVPHCYGWLGLDTRGNWYMRDDRAQACGPFGSGLIAARGSLLRHDKLISFIERNYAADEQGQWYFQNGPQRVYVELESTPWIYRVDAQLGVTTHTGLAATALSCLVDESGHVYLSTDRGVGLVHTLDVGVVADGLETGTWPVLDIRAENLPVLFGFERSPQALHNQHAGRQ